MSFMSDLLEKPGDLSIASKYSVMNGYIYLALGALFIVWPGAVQTLLMDRNFVGDERSIFRVIGMAVAVIGWLYLFGGRSGGRQLGPASVLASLRPELERGPNGASVASVTEEEAPVDPKFTARFTVERDTQS